MAEYTKVSDVVVEVTQKFNLSKERLIERKEKLQAKISEIDKALSVFK